MRPGARLALGPALGLAHGLAHGLALVGASGCREEAAAPKTPVRLSAEEATAALEAREAREATRASATPRAAGEPAGGVGVGAPPPSQVEVLTLGARLLDAEARPLVGAVLARVQPTAEGLPEPQQSARSDASGVVWLALTRAELVATELLDVIAEAPGTMRHFLRLPRERFAGESFVGLGEILLQPGGALRGRVLDEHGAPLAGAFIGVGPELEALGGDAAEMRALARVFPLLEDIGRGNAPPLAVTDGQGAFGLEGLPLGRFMVVAVALPRDGPPFLPDRAEGVLVQLGPAASVRDLVLRAARDEELVRGVVLAPDGSPVTGAFVDLQLAGRSFAGGQTQSGNDGRFAVPAPEGLELELHVSDPEGRYPEGVLAGVRAGEAQAVVRFAGDAAPR